MTKAHMKRIQAPRTWFVNRKRFKFITRPNPGAHSFQKGLSLTVLMRRMVRVAKSSKEARYILNNGQLLVNGKVRKEPKYIVGLMDVVQFPQINKNFRILFDFKGRLLAVPVEAEEAKFKLSQIKSKTVLKKGKIQLNLSDGSNLLIDKDVYNVGDTLQLSLPEQKILSYMKMEKGVQIFLTGGKHSGDLGVIENIEGRNILFKDAKNKSYETLKKYAIVIGKDKPLITLPSEKSRK